MEVIYRAWKIENNHAPSHSVSELEWAKSVSNHFGRIWRMWFQYWHNFCCFLKTWNIALIYGLSRFRDGKRNISTKPVWDQVLDIMNFNTRTLLNTSYGCITCSQGTSLVSATYTAGNGVRSFDTSCNELFIRSASSWASPPATQFIRGSSSANICIWSSSTTCRQWSSCRGGWRGLTPL